MLSRREEWRPERWNLSPDRGCVVSDQPQYVYEAKRSSLVQGPRLGLRTPPRSPKVRIVVRNNLPVGNRIIDKANSLAR